MDGIELFAGAGGLALGVERGGFRHQAVIEYNGDACETLRFNAKRRGSVMRHWPIHETDVRKFDFHEFEGKLDLVSGGPPCQPFSIGGKHRGFRDSRDMFPEAARVVRITRPRAFVFENVRGLLRRSFAKYFEYVLLQLTYPEVARVEEEDWTNHLSRLEGHHTHGWYRGLHYRVVFRLINAADYGVPQRRERVVIVGFRSDICEDWSFPSPTHSELALEYAKWDSGEYWDEHKIPKKNRPDRPRGELRTGRIIVPDGLDRWRTVRDAIADLPNPVTATNDSFPNHRYQPGARAYPGHTGSPLDEPAKTLKAGDHGVPGGENMLASPDGSVRYFTVRESSRLQTFPDWYVFPGSWTESMRQIGNAVPVALGETIAKSIARVLRRRDAKLQPRN